MPGLESFRFKAEYQNSQGIQGVSINSDMSGHRTMQALFDFMSEKSV